MANTGTYLDPPFHRFAHGHHLADLVLERVAGVPGIVLELDGPIPDDIAGHAPLFRTGWDREWATDRYGDSDLRSYR